MKKTRDDSGEGRDRGDDESAEHGGARGDKGGAGPGGSAAHTDSSTRKGSAAGADSSARKGSAARTDSAAAADSSAPDRAAVRTGMSRRRLLGTAGAAGAAGLVVGAAGGAGGYAAAQPAEPVALSTVGSDAVPFHGTRQAGILTPAQAAGHLVAFDLAPGSGRTQAAALLRRWSVCAAALVKGAPSPSDGVAGHDTGIALDAGPSNLTVTIGFGHSFFDRTGLTHQRPSGLDPLPAFSSDHLDPALSDGDLWIQIGADDPLVAFHALRALQKEAGTAARVRWQMNGFNRSPGATAHPMTVRNLMGQKDGTGNPQPSAPNFDKAVFVPEKAAASSPLDAAFASPAWMANGSFAVVRRIRMLLDDWERLSVPKQEKVIGRRKSDGAPLTGGTEHTAMALEKTGPDGELIIPADAHARIAAPAANSGATLLRRGFSYHDGIGADGTPDAGLLFVCWQTHPLKGFVPVQRKLDRGDALAPFIRHEASAVFAVPGGPAPGEYVGQRLLES